MAFWRRKISDIPFKTRCTTSICACFLELYIWFAKMVKSVSSLPPSPRSSPSSHTTILDKEKSNLRQVARQHECATTRRPISGLYCVLYGPTIYMCVYLICLVLTAQRPHVPLRVVVCWQICMPTLKRKWTLFVWRYPKKYFIYFILPSVWEPIAPMCYTRRDEQN